MANLEFEARTFGTVDFYILPEGCVAAIIGFTTPQDACRLEAVSRMFRSAAESDPVWERFLPPDYRFIASRSEEGDSLLLQTPSKKKLYLRLADQPLLIDGSTKCFWLEKSTGKKCCMISARSLSITWSDTPRYWRWTSIPESRFPDVAELIAVCWLEIRGRIKASLLTPKTSYCAYLVFRLTQEAHGLDWHAEASIGLPGGKTETRNTFFETQEEHSQRRQIVPRMAALFNWARMPLAGLENMNELDEGGDQRYPKRREDGWLEMKVGTFFNDIGEDEVELSVLEVKRGNWKSGLIIEGFEVRPEAADKCIASKEKGQVGTCIVFPLKFSPGGYAWQSIEKVGL